MRRLLFHANTRGTTNVSISYTLRDIDGSADDVQAQMALQYRVGDTGAFINLPAGYVADATSGPSQSGLETPVSVVLPVAAENQAKVQIRVITANAIGTDEWVGVDDISITSTVVSPSATLRIVTYNVSTSSGSLGTGLDTLLEAMGNESSYGTVRPIDVLAVQEVQAQSTTTQTIVTLLNNIYGAGTYERGFLNGNSTGSGTQGIIINSDTVDLLGEKAVGVSSTSGQPCQALRYHLRPLQVGAAGDFYLYNSHYKADDDSVSQDRRLTEAAAIRNDADALGQGANVIYSGDFNMYTSSEDAYQKLLSVGNGQAVDPINRPGSWHENGSYVNVFTQAPAQSPPPGLTGGGLDDRFDFHLNSGELANGIGLEYVPGSYHPLGNNGTVPLNQNITYFMNTALSELANRSTVLSLLTTVSDHLPVIADYYFIPAGNPAPATTGGRVPLTDLSLLVTARGISRTPSGPTPREDSKPVAPDTETESPGVSLNAAIQPHTFRSTLIRRLNSYAIPLFHLRSVLYNDGSYEDVVVGEQ